MCIFLFERFCGDFPRPFDSSLSHSSGSSFDSLDAAFFHFFRTLLSPSNIFCFFIPPCAFHAHVQQSRAAMVSLFSLSAFEAGIIIHISTDFSLNIRHANSMRVFERLPRLTSFAFASLWTWTLFPCSILIHTHANLQQKIIYKRFRLPEFVFQRVDAEYVITTSREC